MVAVLEDGEVRDMAELKVYKCDMCPTVKKGDEGGWFRALAGTLQHEPVFIICAWTPDGLDYGGEEDSFHDVLDTISPEMHLCSESCAAKLMSRTIGAGAQQVEDSELSGYDHNA